jgi:primosomal protein N'
LKYPPVTRAALLTLRGHNEDKVKFSAEHVRKELDKLVAGKGAEGKRGKGEKETELVQQTASPLPLFPAAPLPESSPTRFRDLIIAGPAPAPLLRAERFYRYQLMLRTRQMSKLSQALATTVTALALPEGVTLTVDIDPVSLS